MRPQTVGRALLGLLGTIVLGLIVGTALTDGETGEWIWEPKPPEPETHYWSDANRWENPDGTAYHRRRR